MNRINPALDAMVGWPSRSKGRANDLAMAMEARCYRGGKNRTKMKPLKYKRRDFIAFIILAVYLTVVILIKNFLKGAF